MKIPCVAIFISKKELCNFFIFFFSSTKSENRRADQVMLGGRECWYQSEVGIMWGLNMGG
jgi:hypothetical protein